MTNPSTPIHDAIRDVIASHQESGMEIPLGIIERSNNVNEVNNVGATPLHVAVTRNLLLVRHLLEHGADLSLKDSEGRTPLHCAGDSTCSANGLSEEDSYGIYKLLLNRGANCNELDIDNSTPLHHALKFHGLKVIKLLMEYGANIAALTRLGRTSIHFAAENLHVDVIDFVLGQGFEVDCIDPYGYSPLHIAVDHGNFKACGVLLTRGAMVNRKYIGMTPLQHILFRGVSQNMQKAGREATFQVLLEFGADVSGKIMQGLSVLELAIIEVADGRGGSKEIRDLLMQRMAILQYTNVSIDKHDRYTIEHNPFYKELFEKCLQELDDMRETKFYNNLSICDILTERENIISRYARNEELVKALEEQDCETKFPAMYSAYMKKRFDWFYAEVKKQIFRYAVAQVLCGLFKLNEPVHPVNQNILNYLSDQDLQVFKV